MRFQTQSEPMVARVERRLRSAAQSLGTADPFAPSRDLLMRTFQYPADDPRYRNNALMPMAAPFEPSFSETQPNNLRFTIEPLPPEAGSIDRRDASTHEMRRLIGNFLGTGPLYWFDRASEPFRGFASGGNLDYGAFFGSSFDRNGLYASKVYYELPGGSGRIDNLPVGLHRIVMPALQLVPGLKPLFTTLSAQRDMGGQRLTFACTEALKLADLQPVLDALGLGHRLPGIMQLIGLVLGGRFELPEHGALLAFGDTPQGPDFEIYVLLSAIPDVPPSFLSLLTMGLAERPRGLAALERWMSAFTPEDAHWPGRFSIVSLRTDANSPPRVSLYLRPIEFELPEAVARAA
ncbi:hypothetical protein [Sphingosinicella sp. BN140058]|uniref:hypothetical protein n=1 Tax=Sphingosinicella sp. BN140058 TaxID=1892855 RepID=UPI001012CE48|nr:hypothetical protein [Sphingosinicella sp. BN140058]QAY75976.1 hypothetical protein ETR14_05120 [Sphingosinicella sp. BN140058]